MKKLLFSILFLIFCTQAFATVPSATPLFSQYSCNSSTNQFPYTFQISATSDIQVYVNDNNGTITQQPTSAYSVDTSNVWVNYPLVGSPCPTGSTITLVPATPQTQLLSLTARSPFVATAIGSALDKLTLISQQLQGQINRAILAPAGTSAFTFPSAVANEILGWDPAGSGNIVNFVPNTGAYLAKAATADSQTATNDTKYMTPLQVATEVNFSGAVSIPSGNLAGSIADSKLSTISTAGKINTSAITVGGAIGTAQGGTGVTANANAANGVVTLNGSSQLPAVSGALLTNLSGFSKEFIGNFTRDMSTANGTTVVTGVGFKPKIIIFFSTIDQLSGGAIDIGALDGTHGGGVELYPSVSAPSGASIELRVSVSVNQAAVLTSLDTDGFTLTWIKTGSPTGTAYVYYLCIG